MSTYRLESTTDLQRQLIGISVELGERMGCPSKQALSTTLEYNLIEYVNVGYGSVKLRPVSGCLGADAVWVDGGVEMSVECKATELALPSAPSAGRQYLSPTFSILDWPSQLTRREMFVFGMHDAALQFRAAIVVPPAGVKAMFDYEVASLGGVVPPKVSGNRYKMSISLKTVVSLSPPWDTGYILHGKVVDRASFIETFFGRRDPTYLDMWF